MKFTCVCVCVCEGGGFWFVHGRLAEQLELREDSPRKADGASKHEPEAQLPEVGHPKPRCTFVFKILLGVEA